MHAGFTAGADLNCHRDTQPTAFGAETSQSHTHAYPNTSLGARMHFLTNTPAYSASSSQQVREKPHSKSVMDNS